MAPLSAMRKPGHSSDKRAARRWVARDPRCDSSFAIGLALPWYIAVMALLQNRILPALFVVMTLFVGVCAYTVIVAGVRFWPSVSMYFLSRTPPLSAITSTHTKACWHPPCDGWTDGRQAGRQASWMDRSLVGCTHCSAAMCRSATSAVLQVVRR